MNYKLLIKDIGLYVLSLILAFAVFSGVSVVQGTNHEENDFLECFDEIDNDDDGLIDVLDPSCDEQYRAGPETTDVRCHDGYDNDGDQKYDLADPGCAAFRVPENTATVCSDTFDNDLDGRIDLADPDCREFTFSIQSFEEPVTGPIGGNRPTPINVNSDPIQYIYQEKSGILGAGDLYVGKLAEFLDTQTLDSFQFFD